MGVATTEVLSIEADDLRLLGDSRFVGVVDWSEEEASFRDNLLLFPLPGDFRLFGDEVVSRTDDFRLSGVGMISFAGDF